MRSSVEGWVEKSRVMPPFRNGFRMNMCAVAGEASFMGHSLDAHLQFPQPVDQAVRRTGVLGGGRIGIVLAGP